MLLENTPIQKKQYICGLFLFVAGLFLSWLYNSKTFNPAKLLPPCSFRAITGFICPGCGCTRATLALFRGDFIDSFKNNPIVLYCFVIYMLFMVSYTWYYIKKGLLCLAAKITNPSHAKKRSPRKPLFNLSFNQLYFGLILTIIQWIVRLSS